MEYLWCLHA